jgi:methionine synthase II (cobalamin-independent)
MSNEKHIKDIERSLRYTMEDITSARSAASNIKDPELHKKLDAVKDGVRVVKDYLVSKTSKTAG